jgi:hypothetical protein
MAPSELEQHIADTGLLMVAAYNRYERSGCFSDRGEADAWRLQMEAAIALRRSSQVRSMEVERGLAA